MSWRAKIGIIFLADGSTDDEYWQLAPPGVTVHIARIWPYDIPPVYTLQLYIDQAESEEIDRAARCLSIIQPQSIAYACTSASFVRGVGYDREIISRMEKAGGVPATTTSTASVKALQALGVKKVAVASSYKIGEISLRLRQFLEGNGFEVVSVKRFSSGEEDLDSKKALGDDTVRASLETTYQLVKEADTPDAEGIFVPNTAFRALGIVEAVEQDLGKPVVIANQATMWEALRLAGVKPRMEGLGELYRL